MRIALALLGCFAVSALAINGSRAAEPVDASAAIDRGLAFLAKNAIAWRDEHHCVSCHHAALVVWAMRDSKRHGHAVDEPVLAELTQWMVDSGDGKTGLERPASAPRAFNEKAVSFALALGANEQPDAASLESLARLLNTVKADQTESGAWLSWPETRPPIFGHSDERATLAATLALVPAAAGGDEAARAARDRGVAWLTSTPTDNDAQSVALRVVLWRRLGRPMAELQPLVEQIKRRQNPDGGWSQADDMPSDGWATGQALYALTHADVKPPDPAIERGRAFLVGTQREDGSWAMTSRPTKPGGEPSKSLIPITGAGSAWAVIGLASCE